MKTKNFIILKQKNDKIVFYVIAGKSAFFLLFVNEKEKELSYFVLDFAAAEELLACLRRHIPKSFSHYADNRWDDVLHVAVEGTIVRFTLAPHHQEKISFDMDTENASLFPTLHAYCNYPKLLEVAHHSDTMRFVFQQSNRNHIVLDIDSTMVDALFNLLDGSSENSGIKELKLCINDDSLSGKFPCGTTFAVKKHANLVHFEICKMLFPITKGIEILLLLDHYSFQKVSEKYEFSCLFGSAKTTVSFLFVDDAVTLCLSRDAVSYKVTIHHALGIRYFTELRDFLLEHIHAKLMSHLKSIVKKGFV